MTQQEQLVRLEERVDNLESSSAEILESLELARRSIQNISKSILFVVEACNLLRLRIDKLEELYLQEEAMDSLKVTSWN